MTTKNEQNFLIDCIITDLATFLMKDYGVDEAGALRTIYNSEYYSRLADISTGFYLDSSLYNYHYLRHELEHDKIA
ncbi:MAG: hypothetical protein J5605_00535 [Bacteroidales bacterium]|nr:hypothetical protein [Bacteroidales bacterium]